MANGKQRKWLSDVIGDDYQKWNNEFVILDAGTGCGKTRFILNVLSIYARNNNRRVLYICNRRKLRRQIFRDVKKLGLVSTVIVTSYQQIQSKLRNGEYVPYYEYIIADECHYFTTDANFNDYTDLSYEFIMQQKNSVVILMSATAKNLFQWMIDKKKVKKSNRYEVEKDYTYVSKVFFYQKKVLTDIIDRILREEPESKIIVFCGSNRMLEMKKKYSDIANFYCAENSDNKKLRAICEDNCLIHFNDGRTTFDKRILFTTKALDNGVDLKDRNIKHIFSEIFDIDSMIQSLGRKRSLDEYDTCVFYIREYTSQGIQWFLNQNTYQLEPVYLYKTDYKSFCKEYGEGYNRKRISRNKIFYLYFNEKDKRKIEKIKINKMRYEKYLMDNNTIRQMKAFGYNTLVCAALGKYLTQKVEILDIEPTINDDFMEYLMSIEGKRLYQADRERVKTEFEQIGVKIRYLGINTFNGALDDKYSNYKCRFHNKDSNTGKYLVDRRRVLSDGTENKMRDKQYWLLY